VDVPVLAATFANTHLFAPVTITTFLLDMADGVYSSALQGRDRPGAAPGFQLPVENAFGRVPHCSIYTVV
jgi:hypothetical protein